MDEHLNGPEMAGQRDVLLLGYIILNHPPTFGR